MTKSEREALHLLWKTEDLSDPRWQAVLSEEEAALVQLWDLVRRDWWAARARKGAAS